MRVSTISKEKFRKTATKSSSARKRSVFYDGAFGLLKFTGTRKSSINYVAGLRKAWRK